VFRERVKGMQIREVLTAARSPWQNPFAERLIGSIRRDCLDHVIVLSERHLRYVLTGYFAYYHRTRTHLSLTKDASDQRPVEPPELGKVVPIREVGGLHHRYIRQAA
jgi:putative transposase